MRHILVSDNAPQKIGTNMMTDGPIAGNGDIGLVMGGSSDRVRIYISKADFWKADGNALADEKGGISPIGYIEVLLPQMAYAPYHVTEDADRGMLTQSFDIPHFSAQLQVVACATENTILLELDETFPGVSSSVTLMPIAGCGAQTASGECGDVTYMRRSFSGEELEFPTEAVVTMREISRVKQNGRQNIRWAVRVETNHDTAAYASHAFSYIRAFDETDYTRLLGEHAGWWQRFWEKSGVQLPQDEKAELYWYFGLYAIACCQRNPAFPTGLWGNYVTRDSMGWFGDYHLNYNYQAPYYCLSCANHLELTDNYMRPLYDFMPKAKRYAAEYLGCRGVYYPVGIGPLGLETDVRANTKEHGHLFLGQKSNAAYGAVIPMMRWNTERDPAYGRYIYPYFRAVADFWQDYFVLENGEYQSYNDAMQEVAFWSGPDYMPVRQDDKNSVISIGMTRMVFKTLLDLAKTLGVDQERIPKWEAFLSKIPQAKTYERNGEAVLQASDTNGQWDSLSLQYMYPGEQIGPYTTPALFAAAKNTFTQLNSWINDNCFCSIYPQAVRLGFPPQDIMAHMEEVIDTHAMQNGLFAFGGGGLENCSAVPSTVNDMLLQSSEHIVRLFPCWDKTHDAAFHSLRAYDAFVVDASLENGKITATIISEAGCTLALEKPGDNYAVSVQGRTYELRDAVTYIPTAVGDIVTISQS